jgi:uncharacterized protein YodC (DUF2158 family)
MSQAFKFETGAVVRLMSGGQPMTVGWRLPDSMIPLTWFNAAGELRQGFVDTEDMLEAAEPTK